MSKPDPRKLKDEAALALEKGKWKAALDGYLALARLESKDGIWPQKAGEMYRKLGKRDEAVAAFSRAVEAYSISGFLLKAVAVCKLILEIEPSHTDAQAKIASLHSARGLPAVAAPVARVGTLLPGAQAATSGEKQGTPAMPPRPPQVTMIGTPAPSASTKGSAPSRPTQPQVQAKPASAIPSGAQASPANPTVPKAKLEAKVASSQPSASPPSAGHQAGSKTPPAPVKTLIAPAPAPKVPLPIPPPAPPPEVTGLLDLGIPTGTASLPDAGVMVDPVDSAQVNIAALVRAEAEGRAKVRRGQSGVALDQLPLGAMVPGARKSCELSAVEGSVYEIPLDEDDIEVAIPADQEKGVSEEAARAAQALFPRTPLFSSLTERHLRMLIDRVRLVTLDSGEILFQQEDPGDALYVVAEGEVAVLVGGEEETARGHACRVTDLGLVEVARLGEGAFFGEIALLTQQERNATIQATRPTSLLEIDRSVVGDLIEDSPGVLKILLRFLRDRLLDTLVDTNRLFEPFSGEERRRLAARFLFLEVEAGALLVDEGKRAPGLFILLCGRATVSMDGQPVADLGSGDVFGEMSMLTKGPAAASIRAASKSYLLELPRADFSEIIMTHPQVLEYVNTLAEERRLYIEEMLKGKATYREGRLRMV
ncbi:MAG: cyclic nucleotide-binding domain-containing protein [Deltaproteobacteria bacterium]|nr:cyclic nucleotide-binding domain-containing protein [Deltaproteobacteria bacterium]